MTAPFIALEAIELESGVSVFTGEAFVSVRAIGVDGTRLLGQLPPDELARQGMMMIEAGWAARQDKALLDSMTEHGVPVEAAAALMADIRTRLGLVAPRVDE